MKRYFIYSHLTSEHRNQSCGASYAITNGEFPSKRSIMFYHGIAVNVISIVSISEVKNIEDIKQYFDNYSIADEVNYPFKTSDNEYSYDDD